MLRYVCMGVVLLASCTGGDDASAPTLQVSVRTEGLDALGVTTGPLTEAPPGVGREWLNHKVQFENGGDRTVYLQDHRTGAFLGDRELLAGDDGCGWGQGTPGEPITVVCNSDYRPLAIDPGRTRGAPITLWRDLPGMKPVRGARFEFRKPLELRLGGPFTDPRDAGELRATIVVVYTFR